MLALATASSGTDNHVPAVSACGDIWYDVDYDPPAPKSLDVLDSKVRQKLDGYLIERLGAGYASRLSLIGGQIINRKELRAKVPQSVDFKWRPPKYNLYFRFPVAAGADEFCASVQLDDDGTVLEPIGLPNLRVHPGRGVVASASDAINVAKRNGVPIDKATRRLYYFPDSDTIEYEFEFVKHDDGLNILYSQLHVLANDITSIHWSESSAIR